ncbi:hypothetical protein HPB50_016753 [Hyalomma asiaticum]|uniref:Uncharacterized protein n=1 Tax=Hyalomma asiaticum TaxID=266040 RepID=A0ACB7SHS8_HYAAI|nr:hypothetical protein HPB50_016753 [Hyalomma asiaticum]
MTSFVTFIPRLVSSFLRTATECLVGPVIEEVLPYWHFSLALRAAHDNSNHSFRCPSAAASPVLGHFEVQIDCYRAVTGAESRRCEACSELFTEKNMLQQDRNVHRFVEFNKLVKCDVCFEVVNC